MGGAGATQAGIGIMGGTLGGIGDIIQAQNYHQPKLEDPTGPEKRLRQIAQDQLMGGGQQLLGATALYNQLAPILMGQLPGLSYVPGGGDGGGGGGMDTGVGQGGGGGLDTYADSLRQMQHAQALQQQLIDLKAQRKGARKPDKKGFAKQIKALKRDISSQPTVAQQERRAYTAGTQPGAYDIRMGGSGGASGPPSGGPTSGTSLGSINDILSSLRSSGGSSSFDPMALYRGAGGY